MKNNSCVQEIVYADGLNENIFAYVASTGLVFHANTVGTYMVGDDCGNDTTVTIPERIRARK